MILVKLVFVLAPIVFGSTSAMLDSTAKPAPTTTEKKDNTHAQGFFETHLDDAIEAEERKHNGFNFEKLEKKANSRLNVLGDYEDELNFRWPHRIDDNFNNVSEHIRKGDLFRIFKEMPKLVYYGHPTTMATVDFLAGLATEEGAGKENYPHIYVKHDSNNPRNITGFVVTTGELPHSGRATYKFTNVQKYSTLYNVKVTEELKKLLTLNQVKHDAEDVDSLLNMISGLINCKPILKMHLKNIFKVMVENNIQVVEIKASLTSITDINGKEITALDAFDVYKEACREFEEERKKSKEYFKCKLIYAPTNAAEDVRKNQKMFATYKDLLQRDGTDGFLIGMGWMGPKTTTPTIDFYIPQAESKPNTKLFSYHEQFDLYEDFKKELNGATVLPFKRIGHANALPDNPEVMELVKKRKICVEAYPYIYNEMDDVFLLKMLRDEVPFVLSSNDPWFFKENPLTDYLYLTYLYISAVHENNYTRIMENIITNSIQYSGLTKEEKEDALQVWFSKYFNWLEHVAAFDESKLKVLIEKTDWLRMLRDKEYAEVNPHVNQFASIEKDEKGLTELYSSKSLPSDRLELVEEYRKHKHNLLKKK